MKLFLVFASFLILVSRAEATCQVNQNNIQTLVNEWKEKFYLETLNATENECDAIELWNTDSVNNMDRLFVSIGSDTLDFDVNLSEWNTEEVTSMSYTFHNSKFNGDISSWNTKKVRAMDHMFWGNQHFNGDISEWDVSRVSKFQAMFHSTTNFNQDLNKWNVELATDMADMFQYSGISNANLSGWNTHFVTNMAWMFANANDFNGDVSGWNTNEVTNMAQMFYGSAMSFNGDLGTWNVENVINMQQMFQDADAFTGKGLETWNPKSCTTMQAMFISNHGVTTVNLSNWNVESVTNFEEIFSHSSFNGDVSNWKLMSATSTKSMFSYATEFEGIGIETWDVSRVSDFSMTFDRAYSFNGNISGWNVASATRLYQMLSETYRLRGGNVNIANWDVSKVDNFQMFIQSNQHSDWEIQNYLFNADVSSWDTSSATTMSSMFQHQDRFNADISNWNVERVTSLSSMLAQTERFNVDISCWNISRVTTLQSIFERGNSFNYDLSFWNVERVGTWYNAFRDTGLSDCNKRLMFLSFSSQSSTFNSSAYFSEWGGIVVDEVSCVSNARCQRGVETTTTTTSMPTTTTQSASSNFGRCEGCLSGSEGFYCKNPNNNVCYGYIDGNVGQCWPGTIPCLVDSYGSTDAPESSTTDVPESSTTDDGDVPPENHLSQDGDMILYIIVGAIVGILLLATLYFFITSRRSKKKLDREFKARSVEIEKLNSLVIAQRESLRAQQKDMKLMSKAWHLPWSDIELLQKLDRGAFGEVWRATYRENWDVAVKKMFRTDTIEEVSNESEIHFLQRVRHPRLVMFIGAGRMLDNNLFLVLEFMEKGSMRKIIDEDGKSFSWTSRIRILLDVTLGMCYLHGEHNSIHRDLKSQNVLLTMQKGTLRGKVSDFGVSKFMPSKDGSELDVVEAMQGSDSAQDLNSKLDSEDSIEHGCSTPNSTMKATMTAGCGTPSHMAPEVWTAMSASLKYKKVVKFSKKVDVYSFGILMWEALELDVPWKDIKFTFKVAKLVCEGKRPKISTGRGCHDDMRGVSEPNGYVNLMKRCWETNASDRPDFEFISRKCKEYLKSMLAGRKVSEESVTLSGSNQKLLDAAVSSQNSNAFVEGEEKETS